MIDRAKILEELREIAKERSGHCLANEYINSTSKLLFKCKHVIALRVVHGVLNVLKSLVERNAKYILLKKSRHLLLARVVNACLRYSLTLKKAYCGSVPKVINGKLMQTILLMEESGVPIVRGIVKRRLRICKGLQQNEGASVCLLSIRVQTQNCYGNVKKVTVGKQFRQLLLEEDGVPIAALV